MRTITYEDAVKFATHNNVVLCNNILNMDEEIEFYFDTEKLDDVMQVFVCNIHDLKWISKVLPDLLFGYSPLLGCELLFVNHWGTSWEMIQTRMNDDTILD